MLPAKYSTPLLAVATLVLSGCRSQIPPAAPEPGPAGVRFQQADAIRLARETYAKAGIPIGKDHVPEVRFLEREAKRNPPARQEWRVVFVPKAPAKRSPVAAYIDARIGSVRVMLEK